MGNSIHFRKRLFQWSSSCITDVIIIHFIIDLLYNDMIYFVFCKGDGHERLLLGGYRCERNASPIETIVLPPCTYTWVPNSVLRTEMTAYTSQYKQDNVPQDYYSYRCGRNTSFLECEYALCDEVGSHLYMQQWASRLLHVSQRRAVSNFRGTRIPFTPALFTKPHFYYEIFPGEYVTWYAVIGRLGAHPVICKIGLEDVVKRWGYLSIQIWHSNRWSLLRSDNWIFICSILWHCFYELNHQSW